jgi:hypothetical protein
MNALATIPDAPTWHPIAAIPDDRLERDVPVWAGRLVIGTWCDG